MGPVGERRVGRNVKFADGKRKQKNTKRQNIMCQSEECDSSVEWRPDSSQVELYTRIYSWVYTTIIRQIERCHENAGKIGSSLLSTTAPARLVKNPPGPLRIVGHPTGTARKWLKLLFLLAVWDP